MILKYREIRNNTYISTRLIIQDCLVSQTRYLLILIQFKALVSLQIFRSLNKRIIPFPNFYLGFCSRYIYKGFLPTCTLFSHSCGSRTWNFHHQNGNLKFHVFRQLYFNFSIYAWNLTISVVALFFHRHQCIVQNKYKINRKKLISCIVVLIFVVSSFHFIAFHLTEVDPSLWPELLRKVCFLFRKKIYVIFKQYPEAMELLKIPNVYYFPASFMLKMHIGITILFSSFTGGNIFSSLRVSNYTYLTLKLFINLTSVLTLLGLICHMQYIFRKQCEHLTVCTQELQKKFLRAQIIQLFIYLSFDYLTYLCLKLLFREVTDIFLTKREWLPGQSSADFSIESHS
uniref:Serpentine receptor class gamma n=1 Tax=Heterorhabditis bacteriophora TaxID=37862 RepID=A0A1I7W816_HETBA